ncbi:MAG: hypothetical protein WKG07_16265 [Hymenobacter sp.]
MYGAGTDAAMYPAEDNVTQATVNVQTNATAPTGSEHHADCASDG